MMKFRTRTQRCSPSHINIK